MSRFIGGLLIAAAILAALLVFLEQKSPFESVVDEFVFLTLGEDTEMAAGYTDDRFRAVKLGDTEAAVRELLGDPLRYGSRGQDSWMAYSRSPADTHYRLRQLALRGGVVTGILAELYYD